jgi:hypothetical protein
MSVSHTVANTLYTSASLRLAAGQGYSIAQLRCTCRPGGAGALPVYN